MVALLSILMLRTHHNKVEGGGGGGGGGGGSGMRYKPLKSREVSGWGSEEEEGEGEGEEEGRVVRSDDIAELRLQHTMLCSKLDQLVDLLHAQQQQQFQNRTTTPNTSSHA